LTIATLVEFMETKSNSGFTGAQYTVIREDITRRQADSGPYASIIKKQEKGQTRKVGEDDRSIVQGRCPVKSSSRAH